MAPVLSYERLRTRSQTALRNTGPPAETPPHVHSPFSGGVSPTFVLRCFICPPPAAGLASRVPFCPVCGFFWPSSADVPCSQHLAGLQECSTSISQPKETKTKGEDPADTGAAKWFYTRARVGW